MLAKKIRPELEVETTRIGDPAYRGFMLVFLRDIVIKKTSLTVTVMRLPTIAAQPHLPLLYILFEMTFLSLNLEIIADNLGKAGWSWGCVARPATA